MDNWEAPMQSRFPGTCFLLVTMGPLSKVSASQAIGQLLSRQCLLPPPTQHPMPPSL